MKTTPIRNSGLCAAILIVAAFLFSAVPARAQSQTCSSGYVGNPSVEVTSCIDVNSYGNVDGYTDLYNTNQDIPAVGAEVELYQGSTLLTDTGNQLYTDTVNAKPGPPPIAGDTYTVEGWLDECVGSPNCLWEYHKGQESAQYTASCITFSQTGGSVTMSTTEPDSTIFYTDDGSAATEASIEYTGAVTVPPGVTTINAVAVQTTNGSDSAVIHQNEQTVWNDWKTTVACQPGGSCGTTYPCTPEAQNGQGVDGTPPDVYFSNQQSNSCYAPTGSPTTGNLNFVSGSSATSVLWPYNVSSGSAGSVTGCETCTTLAEDFYEWPEYDSASGYSADPSQVAAWESDLIAWNATSGQEPGASLQCNTSVGWQYDYQGSSPWQTLPGPITQDCVGNLPYGTLPAAINNSQTSFSVTPNGSNTIEAGMILRFGDKKGEEILCTAVSGNECTNAVRGWAGTAQEHDSGTQWMGSVHVQYHVSLYPGNNECTLNGGGVDCAFIDYLYLNNVQHAFPQQSGYQHPGVPVAIPTSTPSNDRVFNQFQMDVNSSSGPDVGEYLDQVNVTGSWGAECSASYTVQ